MSPKTICPAYYFSNFSLTHSLTVNSRSFLSILDSKDGIQSAFSFSSSQKLRSLSWPRLLDCYERCPAPFWSSFFTGLLCLYSEEHGSVLCPLFTKLGHFWFHFELSSVFPERKPDLLNCESRQLAGQKSLSVQLCTSFVSLKTGAWKRGVQSMQTFLCKTLLL